MTHRSWIHEAGRSNSYAAHISHIFQYLGESPTGNEFKGLEKENYSSRQLNDSIGVLLRYLEPARSEPL